MMKSQVARVAGEASLWGAANVASIGCAVGGAWLGASALGYSAPTVVFFATLAACASSTWGSWAALSWTRTRWLWLFALGATVVPGLATLALGALAFYLGATAWYLALLFCGAGVGMIAASIALTGRLFACSNRAPDWRTYAASFVAFPIATTALAGAVGALWFGFVSGWGADALWSWRSAFHAITGAGYVGAPSACSGAFALWRGVISLNNVAITTLAIALTTTVVPAAVSRGVREFGDSIARRR